MSFVITDEDGEPSPFSLPMTAVAGQYDSSTPLSEDDGDDEAYEREQESCGKRPFDVYLHGNSAMLLRKMAKSNGSVKVVVSSTKGKMPGIVSVEKEHKLMTVVDGVILHFAPNGHSLNYRSCVIHGDAQIVESADEKRYAMHRLTNHMSRRRWSAVNQVAPTAMESIQVIKVVIRSASAKIRATNINGLEKAGLGEKSDVWTGAIPVFEVLGEPVESGYRPGLPVQTQISDWIQRRNDKQRTYSERVAQVPPEEAEKIHGLYGGAADASFR